MKIDQTSLSEDFKRELAQTELVLTGISSIDECYGRYTTESVRQIIDRCDSLSGDESLEMLRGLNQILYFLRARIGDVDALTASLADSSCTPPSQLRRIVQFLYGQERASKNLLETLTPILPLHLRPE